MPCGVFRVRACGARVHQRHAYGTALCGVIVFLLYIVMKLRFEIACQTKYRMHL